MQTSVEIRNHLVDVLRRDLVGPGPDDTDPLAREELSMPPARWYLTGFLVPFQAPAEIRRDALAEDDLGAGVDDDDSDEPSLPDRPSVRTVFLPSSVGISVLVPPGTDRLRVVATWGDYALKLAEKQTGTSPPNATDAVEVTTDESAGGETNAGASEEGADAVGEKKTGVVKEKKPREEIPWVRVPRRGEIEVLMNPGRVEQELPDSGGMRVVTLVRRVSEDHKLVPSGTLAVSIFLVNQRVIKPNEKAESSFAFQARFEVHIDTGFVARPNVRGGNSVDDDERIAELQFRDAYEYAVGHGASTQAHLGSDGVCRWVETTWTPTAEVEKVVPSEVPGVELQMEKLASATSSVALQSMLQAMPKAYGVWIESQFSQTIPGHEDVLLGLRDGAKVACHRIADGIAALSDQKVFESFRLANAAMAKAARRRSPDLYRKSAPRWRPFQLAFLLMNLRGSSEPVHSDRGIVDLLFFPTGGGKTEAYLGLAAFTLVFRRLCNPGITSAGVSVIMRYTLRLLTLDQLGRASALVCALELERLERAVKGDVSLGPWPFEIGLWVGRAATPNRMGGKDNRDATTALMRVREFRKGKAAAPVPIESCPWCGARFSKNAFKLAPNEDRPMNLEIHCSGNGCEFSEGRALPIVAVDEPFYRRLPCFLIATVDKFAQLPWVGATGALFGKVDRYDSVGFYGPTEPSGGEKQIPGGCLPPPDLVIQDELHLISGPLGTMVGLYETALDTLCERTKDGITIRPKIIASTATVRRADSQIRAIFGRSRVSVFPPPGPDRRDSFFAITVPSSVKHARKYLGIAAPGRSLKVVMLRTYLALLASAQLAWEKNGGAKKGKDNPADPYMPLVGYFSSLRELGGARRIVEDEVRARLSAYTNRTRAGIVSDYGARKLAEPVELTSREPTNRVAESKERLAHVHHEPDHVDVALATNMISVGLDIPRLGLMVVYGQPKTTSEYIQATSRVGRDDNRPGLVITLLNIHRPRDRSHFERFSAYHESFYRSVEATSVTPFSPRALDRGLPAVTVALGRLGEKRMTHALGASEVFNCLPSLSFIGDALGTRAGMHAVMTPEESSHINTRVRQRVADLLDAWTQVSKYMGDTAEKLQYQQELGKSPPPLLRDPLDPELERLTQHQQKFKAQRSLRDVEPTVRVFLYSLNGELLEKDVTLWRPQFDVVK